MKKKESFSQALMKITEFFAKHKIVLLIITALLVIGSVLVIFLFSNINSDMTSYLPSGTYTTDGYGFLQENFGIKGDLIITVGGKDVETYGKAFDEIGNIEGVTMAVWMGSDELIAAKLYGKEEMLRDIFVYTTEDGEELYACILNMEYAASSTGASKVIDTCADILKKYDVDYAFSGSTELAKSILEGTIKDLPKYMAVGFVVVMVILFLTTQSFVEPFILLITLGIAILVNMGTNFIFKSVSIVTYAAASILQLGLSMDYAIFMLHTYRKKREEGLSPLDSAKNAVPYTFFTVFSSALTTVGGFLALYFMSFRVGMDLANVIMKGVLLSLLTVLILQPVLLIITDKLSQKTKHKYLNLKLKKLTAVSMRYRKTVVAISVLLLLPAIYFQGLLDFNYMKYEAPDPNPTQEQIYADKMINQVIVCVPISTTNIDAQYEFVEELNAMDQTDFVLGLCTIVDDKNVAKALVRKPPELLKQYVAEGYAMYTVGLSAELETKECAAATQKLHGIAFNYFGDNYYMTGMAQAVDDFSTITPKDFAIVSVVSVAIVFLILWLTLRSFRMTFLICVIIEFGIWINLGLSYILGGTINFMSYIIISAVQLGATIDYAILLATEYKNNLKNGLIAKDAAYKAATDSTMSIITSALILFGACISVFLISGNLIVAEMTMLIARGAVISALLIIVVLPTTITIGNKIIDKFTYFAYSKMSNDEILYDDENIDTENFEDLYDDDDKK